MKTPLVDRLEAAGVKTRNWPYGTQRRAKVVETRPWLEALVLVDEVGEGHIIRPVSCAYDVGDTGTLTFTEGGPTGGYWRFMWDEGDDHAPVL